MNKLNEEIMSGAKACGICEEWYNMMKDADKDGLLDMYKRGIDFVIKHSFPENSYLLSHSTDEIRHKHLIFIDETVPEGGLMYSMVHAEERFHSTGILRLHYIYGTRAKSLSRQKGFQKFL